MAASREGCEEESWRIQTRGNQVRVCSRVYFGLLCISSQTRDATRSEKSPQWAKKKPQKINWFYFILPREQTCFKPPHGCTRTELLQQWSKHPLQVDYQDRLPAPLSTSAHTWASVWPPAPPVLTHKPPSGSSCRLILITAEWGTMSSWSSRVAHCTLVTVLSERSLSQPRRGVASRVTSPRAQALLILVSRPAPPPSREAAAAARAVH